MALERLVAEDSESMGKLGITGRVRERSDGQATFRADVTGSLPQQIREIASSLVQNCISSSGASELSFIPVVPRGPLVHRGNGQPFVSKKFIKRLQEVALAILLNLHMAIPPPLVDEAQRERAIQLRISNVLLGLHGQRATEQAAALEALLPRFYRCTAYIPEDPMASAGSGHQQGTGGGVPSFGIGGGGTHARPFTAHTQALALLLALSRPLPLRPGQLARRRPTQAALPYSPAAGIHTARLALPVGSSTPAARSRDPAAGASWGAGGTEQGPSQEVGASLPAWVATDASEPVLGVRTDGGLSFGSNRGEGEGVGDDDSRRLPTFLCSALFEETPSSGALEGVLEQPWLAAQRAGLQGGTAAQRELGAQRSVNVTQGPREAAVFSHISSLPAMPSLAAPGKQFPGTTAGAPSSMHGGSSDSVEASGPSPLLPFSAAAMGEDEDAPPPLFGALRQRLPDPVTDATEGWACLPFRLSFPELDGSLGSTVFQHALTGWQADSRGRGEEGRARGAWPMAAAGRTTTMPVAMATTSGMTDTTPRLPTGCEASFVSVAAPSEAGQEFGYGGYGGGAWDDRMSVVSGSLLSGISPPQAVPRDGGGDRWRNPGRAAPGWPGQWGTLPGGRHAHAATWREEGSPGAAGPTPTLNAHGSAAPASDAWGWPYTSSVDGVAPAGTGCGPPMGSTLMEDGVASVTCRGNGAVWLWLEEAGAQAGEGVGEAGEEWGDWDHRAAPLVREPADMAAEGDGGDDGSGARYSRWLLQAPPPASSEGAGPLVALRKGGRFLAEESAALFDSLYRRHAAHMLVRSPTVVAEQDLVRDALYALQGVPSATLTLDAAVPRQGMRLPSTGACSLPALLSCFSFAGTVRQRLDCLVASLDAPSAAASGQGAQPGGRRPPGLVAQAFLVAVRAVLCAQTAMLQAIGAARSSSGGGTSEGWMGSAGGAAAPSAPQGGAPPVALLSNKYQERGLSPGRGRQGEAAEGSGTPAKGLSLIGLYVQTDALRCQLTSLAKICRCLPPTSPPSASQGSYGGRHVGDGDGADSGNESRLPSGAALLDYLYVRLQEADPLDAPLLRFLFARAAAPYLAFVRGWLYRGTVQDPFAEFMVAAAPVDAALTLASGRDVDVKYRRSGASAWEAAPVPAFLRGVSQPLLRAGMQLRVLQCLDDTRGFAQALACSAEQEEAEAGVGAGAAMTGSMEARDGRLPLDKPPAATARALPLAFGARQLEVATQRRAHYGASRQRSLAGLFQEMARVRQLEEDARDAEERQAKEAALERMRQRQLAAREEAAAAQRKREALRQERAQEMKERADARQVALDARQAEQAADAARWAEEEQLRAEVAAQMVEASRARIASIAGTVVAGASSQSEAVAADGSGASTATADAPALTLGSITLDLGKAGEGGRVGDVTRRAGEDPGRDDASRDADLFNAAARVAGRGEEAATDAGEAGQAGVGQEHGTGADGAGVLGAAASAPAGLERRGGSRGDNPVTWRPTAGTLRDRLRAQGGTDRSPAPREEDQGDVYLRRREYGAGWDAAVAAEARSGVVAATEARGEARQTSGAPLLDDASSRHGQLTGKGERSLADKGGALAVRWMGGGERLDEGGGQGEGEGGELAALAARGDAAGGDGHAPLEVVMDACVGSDVRQQYRLVSAACCHLFLHQLRLVQHCSLLRRFLFMQGGDFAYNFVDLLLQKAHAPKGWRNPSQGQVQEMLGAALRASTDACADEYADRLRVEFVDPPPPQLPVDPFRADALSFIRLRYSVGWPLSEVITPESLLAYARVGTFLLTLQHVSFAVRDICSTLQSMAKQVIRRTTVQMQRRRQRASWQGGDPDACSVASTPATSTTSASASTFFSSSVAGGPLPPSAAAPPSHRLQRTQVFLREITHFVGILQGHLHSQLRHVSWRAFQERLRTEARDMEELRRVHAEYVDDACRRCMQSKERAPLLALVTGMFQCVLDLQRQLRLVADPTLLSEDRAYEKIRRCHLVFVENVRLLYKMAKAASERGQQLSDLIIRLNFNGHYD
eukprot:jgi/Mesvir1/28688/Mv11180-RA.1